MKKALIYGAWLIFLAATCAVSGYNLGVAQTARSESAWYSDLSRALATERCIGRNDAVIQIREYLGARGEANAKRLVLDWWSEQVQKERQSVLSAGAETLKGEADEVHD
jgi:hypothetical protein